MHGKERVIRPLLERPMHLDIRVTAGLDTDRFGTFSRDVARQGSPLDAARRKIEAAFALDPDAEVAIASEGSFGPHPAMPLVPAGREIVVLSDRVAGLELIGRYTDPATNFAHDAVHSPAEADAFARRVGFPRHGVIVMAAQAGTPRPDHYLEKDVADDHALSEAVVRALTLGDAAHVETDMRAHRNPTRMRAIRRATIDLIRAHRSRCPQCHHRGFVATEPIFGLPCGWCGSPTSALRSTLAVCARCGHHVETPVAARAADPGQCTVCNP